MLMKTEIKIAGLSVWIELEHSYQRQMPEASKRLAEAAFAAMVTAVRESK